MGRHFGGCRTGVSGNVGGERRDAGAAIITGEQDSQAPGAGEQLAVGGDAAGSELKAGRRRPPTAVSVTARSEEQVFIYYSADVKGRLLQPTTAGLRLNN